MYVLRMFAYFAGAHRDRGVGIGETTGEHCERTARTGAHNTIHHAPVLRTTLQMEAWCLVLVRLLAPFFFLLISNGRTNGLLPGLLLLGGFRLLLVVGVRRWWVKEEAQQSPSTSSPILSWRPSSCAVPARASAPLVAILR